MLAQPLTLNHPMAHPGNGRFFKSRSPDRTLQYAIPAQQITTRNIDPERKGLSFAEHELLRQRKTPHGRYYEEQNESAFDENIQQPASKHVVLSLSPSTRERAYPKPRSVDIMRSGKYASPVQGQHDSNQYQASRSFVPAWDFPGGIDSVLNQTLPMQTMHCGLYQPRSNIPTVLPSSFSSSFGPTASAGQQFYGPYWPDGTYSPYRPAPIRDVRFYNHDSFRNEPKHQDPSAFPNRMGNSFQPTSTALHEFEVGLGMQNGSSAYPSFQERISNVLTSSSAYRDSQIPYDSNYGLKHPIRAPHFEMSHTLEPNKASDHIAYRDKTFTWAHNIYVDLLAQIQRGGKHGKQVLSSSGGVIRQFSKPSIYPRPPNRKGSHFAESSLSAHKVGHQTHMLTHGSIGNNGRPQTAIRFSSQKTFTLSDHGKQPGTDFRKVHSRDSSHLAMPSEVRRFNDATEFQFPTNIGGNPASLAAYSAMEAMERLCQDSDVPWVDGMLLAGCLAYGLNDYPKALTWFQCILAQDHRHVEAMSNLAATFLALDRRDEALRYWSTAVELRPSYFEAVEHLIGLLCSTHRAKDAVQVIEQVQSRLRINNGSGVAVCDEPSDGDSDCQSRASSATLASSDYGLHDFDFDRRQSSTSMTSDRLLPGFGSAGYTIPASDNGRLIALIHAKGNMLYALGNNRSAAEAFEDAILIATSSGRIGIRGLIERILRSCISTIDPYASSVVGDREPLLLTPDRAQQTAHRMFPPSGELPGLEYVPTGLAYKAAVSTTSNSLLSLAKIYQDGLSTHAAPNGRRNTSTREILALYYLSLSLQPSPSTANNVGILLASVQHTAPIQIIPQRPFDQAFNYTGVMPGSGTALALSYYNYGLNLDGKHAHLYTNLGSLLKDLGQLPAAVKMYETAVSCDGKFDIALANLANAVKDQGRVADAITYYKRAVQANPDFAEAVCGLATALNSVCDWKGRGGVFADKGRRDRIHVDDQGMVQEARKGSGWLNRVVEIVDRQLRDGESWGIGVLTPIVMENIMKQLMIVKSHQPRESQSLFFKMLRLSLQSWAGQAWEGSRVVRLIERATRFIGWQWYQDRYIHLREFPSQKYARPALPGSLTMPNAPTVLPFHTFTTPLSAKQVRQISQRNALRISVSTLRYSWLPKTVYPPPAPPAPCLRVGYVSSDFNNHPLAHLMQSVFGLHNPNYVRAYCYATTSSDGSIHRQQIEREAPVFHDASSWGVERLVNQVVADGIHVLVNLNGYTRGARNEVFAARPAPIHMSFMGFAGTLGAEWCDYVFADPISVLQETLSPWRQTLRIEDRLRHENLNEDAEDWIYSENIIFSRASFFCVDHKQSAPDAKGGPPRALDLKTRESAWESEQDRRWKLRRELFPSLSDNAIILGNFNQLYKIDPGTFRVYLRILAAVPNAILWLLRFPDLGEKNLMKFAKDWAGSEIAQRVVFTDVAPKGTHITRASVVDLFLDTPECNAHTTAADVIWSGTPILTWAKWKYKMCSRMASSIVASAFPEGEEGEEGRRVLLVQTEEQYEDHAIQLASSLLYPTRYNIGRGRGKLMDFRRQLWEGRWTSRLFDTKRWVRDLEQAYWKAWRDWETGESGDIHL